jgi:hypothetical protein
VDEIKVNDLDPTDLPFFARFLEGQMEDLSAAEADEIVGGRVRIARPIGIVFSKKYPSDHEDSRGCVLPMTKKYPADREDLPGDLVVTQKFPSDGEDNHGGGIATTLKYPSDNEDNLASSQ